MEAWSLEKGQVTVDLGTTHGGVPGQELPSLDGSVVVDVVAVRCLAEGLAEHFIAGQLVDGVEEGRRQRTNPAPSDLVRAEGVEVVPVGFTGGQSAVDPV